MNAFRRRGKREEGRGKREEGRGKREEGRGAVDSNKFKFKDDRENGAKLGPA
jgi:hypothetical protein